MDVRDEMLEMINQLTGVSVSGSKVTILPKEKPITIRANKNGKGYVTSYTVSIGCAEAVQAGFVDADKRPLPLEKVVDAENHSITFRLKQ